MFYDDEELLEAVDILMEDYDLTEDEAIDLLMEDYEDDFDDEELDELSEAVDILMEDYDLTEDEAIDFLLDEGVKDTYERARDSWNGLSDEQKKTAKYAGAALAAQSAITTAGASYATSKIKNRLKAKNGSPIDKIKARTKKARKRRLRNARVKKVKKALHIGGKRRRRR